MIFSPAQDALCRFRRCCHSRPWQLAAFGQGSGSYTMMNLRYVLGVKLHYRMGGGRAGEKVEDDVIVCNVCKKESAFRIRKEMNLPKAHISFLAIWVSGIPWAALLDIRHLFF